MKLTYDYPKKIILALTRQMYLTQITKITKTSSNRMTGHIKILIKNRIVKEIKKKKVGQRKFVELTKNGWRLRALLIKIGEFEK